VTDLFAAGHEGYATCRIPGIVVTKTGAVLAYCEARKSGTGDWAQIDVMMRRSADGGRTWEAPRRIASTPAGAKHNPAPIALKLKETGRTTNNPVAIADPVGGTIHFLYCENYARCYYLRSDDDGRTFTRPAEITAAFDEFRPQYDWKVIATGPGHGIRTKAGRLVVPIWMSPGTSGNGHHPSCVATIYSDDDGKTWHGGQIVASDSSQAPNPNETCIAQLDDGWVMLNVRNESPRNRRLVTTSANGSSDWSTPAFDETLFDPICFASLLAIPGKNQLLFSNPDSSAAGGNTTWKARKNLTIRLSRDGGKTWPLSKVLEPGIAGYSDLACSPDGSIIYCLYERAGVKGDTFHVQFLSLGRFSITWLDSSAP
jgi:sialidase-1